MTASSAEPQTEGGSVVHVSLVDANTSLVHVNKEQAFEMM